LRANRIQTVLELEAAVQRNMSDASAWFELGVKQQEYERETQALQALSRAMELDPSYLPGWLALSVSHTNDGRRLEAYDAIREWVVRNDKHRDIVQQHLAQFPESGNATPQEKFSYLVQCLITMAQQSAVGQIDADIQIALAVLFNSNEVCTAVTYAWDSDLNQLFPGLRKSPRLFQSGAFCSSR
jgi:peroxin-5